MNDWQVGDLALCVDDRQNPHAIGPCRAKAGQIYCVAGVSTVDEPNTLFGRDGGGLYFDFDHQIYAAARFRKIRPDAHEACEEEFITLLRRTERKVSA
jgi:hypothetical protein